MPSRIRNRIYGWGSESELATEVYGSQFRDLLDGILVFAYRNPKKSGTIGTLIVTKTQRGFRYALLPVEGSWTCYCSFAAPEFMKGPILDDLRENKTEKDIIDDYVYCIDYYDENKHSGG